jgi:hypothetical protein
MRVACLFEYPDGLTSQQLKARRQLALGSEGNEGVVEARAHICFSLESVMRFFVLLLGAILAHTGLGLAQDGSPACSADTQACTTSCIDAGETSDLVLDCRKTCSQFNSDYNGYCYARPFANRPLSAAERESIYRREVAACTASECDPTFNLQLGACSADKATRMSCSKQAIQEQLTCATSCATRAIRKARGS